MAQERKKVSVILLSYNRAEYLPAAVESVLNQSYPYFELLIIDDGSTDGSQEIIAGYDDQRIVPLYREHRGKISQLRNLGMREAGGDYIAFIDSDDIWKPQKLAQQVRLLEDCSAGFTFCDVEEFSSGGILKNRIYQYYKQAGGGMRGNIFPETVSGDLAVYPSALLFKKTCLETTGEMPEEFPVSGEYEFIARLAYHYEGVIWFEPLVKIRKHETNISAIMEAETYRAALAIVKKFYAENYLTEKQFRQISFKLRYRRGMFFRNSGDFEKAAREFRDCLRLNRASWKALTRYILSRLS